MYCEHIFLNYLTLLGRIGVSDYSESDSSSKFAKEVEEWTITTNQQ